MYLGKSTGLLVQKYKYGLSGTKKCTYVPIKGSGLLVQKYTYVPVKGLSKPFCLSLGAFLNKKDKYIDSCHFARSSYIACGY